MQKKPMQFDLLLSGIALLLMVLVVFVGVIFRIAGSPLIWTEEIARWMLVWITFAGASYCFQHGGLISVDYFVRKLFPAKAQKVINIIAMSLMTGFFMVLLYSSCKYAMLTIYKAQVYPVTLVPTALIVLALIVGSILTTIFSIRQIVGIAKKKDPIPTKEDKV